MALFRRTKRQGDSTVTVTGSVATNSITDSDRAKQDIKQTIVQGDNSTFDLQLTEFTHQLRNRLPEVNGRANAAAIADEIDAASRDKDTRRLRVALSSAQTAIAVALGTAAGDDLWKLLQPLLAGVGLGA